jgi:hypothetical protein
MWEDEEGSMTLAQKPFRGFQGYFPIYFIILNGQMRPTGLSVPAARVIPACMGILSILFTFVCLRRYVSARAALIACLLLSLNIGHVFFSQSVRYYTTALVFQLLALAWFLQGFEEDRIWPLAASVFAFTLGLLTHFSAVLLAPVFVGYLLLTIVRGESGNGYHKKNYVLFGMMLVAVLTVFAWRIMQLRNMIGGWAIPSQRDPVHTALTFLAYFGIPLLGLALLAPWLARQLRSRILLFLLCAGFLPVLEVLVIAGMNVVNVTWYYAMIALVGLALLAGAGLVGLWERGYRISAGGLGVAAVSYYVVFLLAYNFNWHGDRPRWAEAAAYLHDVANIDPAGPNTAEVYATVPGVVAFYLGADPRRPETYAVVRLLPRQPVHQVKSAWYVVEAKVLSAEFRDWFANHCTLEARFESMTGHVDRTVLVYRSKGDSLRQGEQSQRAASSGSDSP